MEGRAILRSDIGAIPPASRTSAVRWRWLVLLAAVVIPFGIAFAIGAATKSKTSVNTEGSLARAVSVNAPPASVTAVNAGVPVPPLKAPAAQSKPQSTATSTSSTPSAQSSTTPSTPPSGGGGSGGGGTPPSGGGGGTAPSGGGGG
jgi:uncharacterized membrane protein YgcG